MYSFLSFFLPSGFFPRVHQRQRNVFNEREIVDDKPLRRLKQLNRRLIVEKRRYAVAEKLKKPLSRYHASHFEFSRFVHQGLRHFFLSFFCFFRICQPETPTVSLRYSIGKIHCRMEIVYHALING